MASKNIHLLGLFCPAEGRFGGLLQQSYLYLSHALERPG